MTYIAGIRSADGFVLAADTLQVYGDGQTTFFEKLVTDAAGEYALTIGGAGNGQLIDCFIQQAMRQIRKDNPQDDVALEGVIGAALQSFYKTDVVYVPADNNFVQFIIGAWHKRLKSISLWWTQNAGVFPVSDHAVIGCEPALGWHLIRRFYRPDLSLNQLVSLATYLVAVAKDTMGGVVGGPTRIVLGRNNGIVEIDAVEIRLVQERIHRIDAAYGQFLLAAADLSLTDEQFGTERSVFTVGIGDVRSCHSEIEARRRPLNTINDPYPLLPLGTRIVGVRSESE